MFSRRGFLNAVAAGSTLGGFALGNREVFADARPPLLDRLLHEFVAEALPEGGVDRSKSFWQKPGRGAAVGAPLFPGGIDPRYFRFAVEAMYRFAAESPDRARRDRLRSVADAHVGYMARHVTDTHPTWAIGNALELVGIAEQFKGQLEGRAAVAAELVGTVRKRAVQVTTLDNVTYRHFPCGYGLGAAKDAGWTNDLSMLGSGLVHAYELTGDPSILADAVQFAEYFVQSWRPSALGSDGYWRCGTWHEQIGSWVIGPAHFSGFESTDAFADEASWVFSTVTCIDYLTRLYRHKRDPRYLERCAKAAEWTFRACQFPDGAVGMCGRDDKWLGFTADAITQVAQLRPLLGDDSPLLPGLLHNARRAMDYLRQQVDRASIEDHGVEWVHRKTSIDPLVNVAMLWASLLLGWLNGLQLFTAQPPE